MFLVGITGKSGSGKNYIASLLSERFDDSIIIDCDKVYHDLISNKSDCTLEIANAFGDQVLKNDGSINRDVLRDIVFNDKDCLVLLNKISHKYVRDKIFSTVDMLKSQGVTIIFVNAPQLIESGLNKDMDFNIFVKASVQSCVDRICDRDKIPEEAAKLRLSNQLLDKQFSNACDAIITNELNTTPKIEEVITKIKERIDERDKDI